MDHRHLRITARPRALQRWLVGVTAAVAAAGVAADLAYLRIDHGYARRILGLLSLDAEHNLPAWYSSLLLLGTALLLAIAASSSRRADEGFTRHWTLLALGFLYLAVDEAVGLHELANAPVRQVLGTRGWLHFAWVIPAVAVVLLVALAYLPFLRHLPRRTAGLFVLAGALYVGGAVGLELVAGAIVSAGGHGTTTYVLAAAVEEILEMTGVVVFLLALVEHLRARVDVIEIVRTPDEAA